MTNDDDNPMSKAHAAPRCTATSKRTGELCKGPAVNWWRVCRFHGAGGGHARCTDHPSWRNGMRALEWIEARAAINELVRDAREIECIHCGAECFEADEGDADLDFSGLTVRMFYSDALNAVRSPPYGKK